MINKKVSKNTELHYANTIIFFIKKSKQTIVASVERDQSSVSVLGREGRERG